MIISLYSVFPSSQNLDLSHCICIFTAIQKASTHTGQTRIVTIKYKITIYINGMMLIPM